MFFIGQQVVCIDDNFAPARRLFKLPVKGQIYTIRGFMDEDGDDLAVWLEEIVNNPAHFRDGFGECSFYVWRFRPLKATDISIFTAILNNTKINEDA